MTPKTERGPAVPKARRDAQEATDEALMRLEGLISALDVVENQITFPDEQAAYAKAFRTLRPLMVEKINQVWALRDAE